MPRNPRSNRLVVNAYPYVRCKVLRHRFDAVGPVPGGPRRSSFGTLVTFRCDNCGTLRFDVLSRLTGELLARWYDHPDDYKTDHQTMAQWRVELMDSMDNSLLLDLGEAQ